MVGSITRPGAGVKDSMAGAVPRLTLPVRGR